MMNTPPGLNLPELCSHSWRGGPSEHTMQLTAWPGLEKSWSPFYPVYDTPVQVSAQLSIHGGYGSSLHLRVGRFHVRQLESWSGCSPSSAKRLALSHLYERHDELVREALSCFYGNKVSECTRSLVLGVDGTPLATFFDTNDAEHCPRLPNHFYEWFWRKDWKTYQGCEVRHRPGFTSASRSPEITARIAALIAARAETQGE